MNTHTHTHDDVSWQRGGWRSHAARRSPAPSSLSPPPIFPKRSVTVCVYVRCPCVSVIRNTSFTSLPSLICMHSMDFGGAHDAAVPARGVAGSTHRLTPRLGCRGLARIPRCKPEACQRWCTALAQLAFHRWPGSVRQQGSRTAARAAKRSKKTRGAKKREEKARAKQRAESRVRGKARREAPLLRLSSGSLATLREPQTISLCAACCPRRC